MQPMPNPRVHAFPRPSRRQHVELTYWQLPLAHGQCQWLRITCGEEALATHLDAIIGRTVQADMKRNLHMA